MFRIMAPKLLVLSLALWPVASCSLLVDFQECSTTNDCSTASVCVDGICEDPQLTRVEVSGTIGKDTKWTANNIYILKNIVTVVPSATLTIEPGTTILGERNSALVARSGGKIISVGTRDKPIVFTSAKPVGQRLAGDWGGVAMLGKAPVNRPNAVLNIFTDEAEAGFGGADKTWNCGAIKYTRFEFGGGQVKGQNALNGLTLAGCGDKTEIEHVQIHFGEDDGLEIFGGTVNIRRVLITRSQNDGLDLDIGWQGTGQFIAIMQDAAGDNAIEVDNRGEEPTATPLTDFKIYNYTLIGAPGGGNQRAITFKDGGAGQLSHGIISGFPLEAVDVEGAESGARALNEEALIKNTLFYKIGAEDTHYFPITGEPLEVDPMTMMGDDDTSMMVSFEEDTFFRQTQWGNVFGKDPGIKNPFNLLTPGWIPEATNTTGQQISAPPAGFDPTAVYLGAFGPGVDPWTEDWTDYPES